MSVPDAEYDHCVVGGGVGGLLCALRLAGAGGRVLLVERDLLGAGATVSNQGIVHSGAMFSQLHPDVTVLCQAARAAYVAEFPDIVLDVKDTWYLARAQRLDMFRALWTEQSVGFAEVDPHEVAESIAVTRIGPVDAVSVRDTVISSRELVRSLAERCIASGVRISVRTPVAGLLLEHGRVAGVDLGAGRAVRAAATVLACGIGTRRVLAGVRSAVVDRLKSRLDMIVAFRNRSLQRSVMSLEYGWPTVSPSSDGMVLGSRYGGSQPWISRPGPWPVAVGEATKIIEGVAELLRPGIVDATNPYAWACSKTELTNGHEDAWRVEPNFAVVDHGVLEGLAGLYTVLPGKMTLAMHASARLAEILTGTSTLPLGGVARPTAPDQRAVGELITPAPWLAIS